MLEQIEASLSVKSIGTGMKLRDEHMRKYVFTTDTGEVPDVRFVGDKAECSKVSANQSTCQVAGSLTIRGTARPFSIALKVKEDGDRFHASGDSVVRLSAYGIEPPSQLGVTTSDEVKLRLEFTARPGREALADRRAARCRPRRAAHGDGQPAPSRRAAWPSRGRPWPHRRSRCRR